MIVVVDGYTRQAHRTILKNSELMAQHVHLRNPALFFLATVIFASPVGAITPNWVDDFQGGTTLGWSGVSPTNDADSGPGGPGDYALHVSAQGGGGPGSRLITYNRSQWKGDWTASGVSAIAMDLYNPETMDLSIRLGIGGPGGVQSFGTGEVFVTPAVTIPGDNSWHSVSFGATAADFVSAGGTDIHAALADVEEFRVLHNGAVDIRGAIIDADIYVDNIRVISEPSSLAGDYNGNDVVDAADYVVWRDNLGEADESALSGNGDGSGGIDQADYLLWKNNFGSTLPGSGDSAAVPEPAALSLVVLITVATLVGCRTHGLPHTA